MENLLRIKGSGVIIRHVIGFKQNKTNIRSTHVSCCSVCMMIELRPCLSK